MRNSRDYLLNYAKDKDNWLRALINESIESNGCISEERKEEILKSYLEDKEMSIIDCDNEIENSSDKIRLTKLNHKEGVNALARNETIKFCDDINILYGMNGTGKSSYFRILNEIVGGNQEKEILPNINIPEPEEIKVKVSYRCNNEKEKTEGWDGSFRSLPKLNKCMVYDTSYQNGLLTTREANTTLLEPLGLHLFGNIIETLDDMKIKIDNMINSLKSNKPNLEMKYLNEETKTIFNANKYSIEEKSSIEKMYKFSDSKMKKLKEIKDKIKRLEQNNLDDKIKLLQQEDKALELLIKDINCTYDNLEKKIKKTKALLEKYSQKKNELDLIKKNYGYFKEIPKSSSKEWNDFIRAGDKYLGILEVQDENQCPYCWQQLQNERSLEIVESYNLFLENKTQLEIGKILEEISKTKNEVESIKVDISYQENIEELLKENKLADKIILKEVNKMSRNYIEVKENILSLLEEKTIKPIVFKINKDLLNKLKEIKETIVKRTDIYMKEKSEREKELIDIIKIKDRLEENKSIFLQRKEIKKWFDILDNINSLTEKKEAINSRNLSLLSRDAHEDLLTESLREKFTEELNNIGLSNLEVELKNKGVSKGVSSTQLVIKSNNDVKTILSEGEQRAIALSLFIAEIRLQNDLNPIIMDDPVNSLDHKIANKFAERLMELDNQIIIFTHNRLFLDSFEMTKDNHVCKTIDSDCNSTRGKHIRIYEIISYGPNNKGILTQYSGKKAKNRIKEIRKCLNNRPFQENTKVATLIRILVESIIDEVVFNNQVPTKHSNKKSRIHWRELKELNSDSELIDRLQAIHSRVSGGSIHRGTESDENPIEYEEYMGMINELEEILTTSKM